MLPRKKEVEQYFIFPSHLTSVSALSGKTQKHENHIFSVKCCITAFPEFYQSLLDFFHIHAGIDSLNLVINWVQLCHRSGEIEVESFVQQLLNTVVCLRIKGSSAVTKW